MFDWRQINDARSNVEQNHTSSFVCVRVRCCCRDALCHYFLFVLGFLGTFWDWKGFQKAILKISFVYDTSSTFLLIDDVTVEIASL